MPPLLSHDVTKIWRTKRVPKYTKWTVREGFPEKKTAVLLDFAQIRGGGGRALPKKKLYMLSKLGGGGKLDKIQKNSIFFRETFPYSNIFQNTYDML